MNAFARLNNDLMEIQQSNRSKLGYRVLLRRRRNVTLLRTLGPRRLSQLRPKGAALGLSEGYHVETACFGGPTAPKRCDFRGSGFVLLPGLRSLSLLFIRLIEESPLVDLG